jgi:hypothetical protein
VEVLDQPFVAHGRRATAGGCLASVYLATWVIASVAGRQVAEQVLRSVAPVGEAASFANHALGVVGPYLVNENAHQKDGRVNDADSLRLTRPTFALIPRRFENGTAP